MCAQVAQEVFKFAGGTEATIGLIAGGAVTLVAGPERVDCDNPDAITPSSPLWDFDTSTRACYREVLGLDVWEWYGRGAIVDGVEAIGVAAAFGAFVGFLVHWILKWMAMNASRDTPEPGGQ